MKVLHVLDHDSYVVRTKSTTSPDSQGPDNIWRSVLQGFKSTNSSFLTLVTFNHVYTRLRVIYEQLTQRSTSFLTVSFIPDSFLNPFEQFLLFVPRQPFIQRISSYFQVWLGPKHQIHPPSRFSSKKISKKIFFLKRNVLTQCWPWSSFIDLNSVFY